MCFIEKKAKKICINQELILTSDVPIKINTELINIFRPAYIKQSLANSKGVFS